MRVLFIGNSHTYFNDMPALLAGMAKERGVPCEVFMLAHGGWYLRQHLQGPEARFNIRCGGFHYVVLQEHAHPFEPEEMFPAGMELCELIRQAGSVPVAYMTWTRKDDEAGQAQMTQAYESLARQAGAILAPVGVRWWRYHHEHPEVELYDPDGAHASPEGSALAAGVILEAMLSGSADARGE